MSIILKPLFEILTGEVAVCENILLNYAIMLGIGEIAFQAARSLVGDAYRAGMISGKSAGSILHWTIRLLIYVVIAYLLRAAISIYLLFASIPGWIWICIVGITSCLLIAFWAYRNYTAKKSLNIYKFFYFSKHSYRTIA